MSTPADELRAAATKLRMAAATAAEVSPSPWLVTDELVIRCSNEERGIVADRSCEPDEAGDLPYIAAMHPGVGAALADWLDETAEQYEAAVVAARQVWGDEGEPEAREWLTTGHGRVGKQSLAVARAINAQP